MRTFQFVLTLSGLLGVAFLQPPVVAFAPLQGRLSRCTNCIELAYVQSDEDEISYAEQSRRFRRTNFNHEDWVKQRNNYRLLRSLRSTLRSGVVRQLFVELGLVATIAIGTCLWNALLVVGYQDFSGVTHSPLMNNLPLLSLPLEPFSLSSPALGLLLVFRTNASYGRWMDARKAWGAVVNHSRNIVRLGSGWIMEDNDAAREHLECLANAVWAFPRCLQRHLLGEREDDESFRQDILQHLSPEVAQNLINARHKPTRALHDLTHVINSLPLPFLRRVEIDKSAVALCEAMGVCDRIFASPVPRVYTRHTARFLGFWILALPLGLWESFGNTWNHFCLLPASLFISFFLFGIEELATQLEEPFSILPIDIMVNGIRLSADEAVEWHFDDESTRLRQLTKTDASVELLEQLLKSHGST